MENDLEWGKLSEGKIYCFYVPNVFCGFSDYKYCFSSNNLNRYQEHLRSLGSGESNKIIDYP